MVENNSGPEGKGFDVWSFLDKHWRAICVLVAFIVLLLLMAFDKWPFDQKSIAIAHWLDVAIFLFADEIFVGLFKLSFIGLGFYVVLSIISQVLRDRWINGLSKDGVQIDGLDKVYEKSEQIIKERDTALIKIGELQDVATNEKGKASQLEDENEKVHVAFAQLSENFDQMEQDRDEALSIAVELRNSLSTYRATSNDLAASVEEVLRRTKT